MIRIFCDFTNTNKDEVIDNIKNWLVQLYLEGTGTDESYFEAAKKLLFEEYTGEYAPSCAFIECDDSGAIIIPGSDEGIAFEIAWKLLNQNSYHDYFSSDLVLALAEKVKNTYPNAEIFGWMTFDSQYSGIFANPVLTEGGSINVDTFECVCGFDYEDVEFIDELKKCGKGEFIAELKRMIAENSFDDEF